jgi:predicted small secreted protein
MARPVPDRSTISTVQRVAMFAGSMLAGPQSRARFDAVANLDPRVLDVMDLRFEPLSKVIFMCKKTMRSTLILLAFLGIAPLLGACHTTAGAGQDISKTGQAITRTANNATPR